LRLATFFGAHSGSSFQTDFEVIVTIRFSSTFPPCFSVRNEMIPSSELASFSGKSPSFFTNFSGVGVGDGFGVVGTH
jgi:hypothetical protein